MTPLSSVRSRPAMYVGDVDGDGPTNLVLELVANALDQHLGGRCQRVEIRIDERGGVRVTDDGPGMSVAPTESRPGLHEMLTTLSDRPTVDGHRPHAHLGSGGLGVFVVNALSERFEITTIHAGVRARAVYARGEVVEAFSTQPTSEASGTTIAYVPDPTIFRHARIERAKLATVLEDLAFLAPGLAISWSVDGEALARTGLAGRVGAQLGCEATEVASHRETFATPAGPLDVEVALAWTDPFRAAVIDSFVNFMRTREHGAHVDGLLDGICAVARDLTREQVHSGLVAAVAVVLADVTFGNPRKDRLVSVEVRAPVAEATRRALEAWAARHPERAARAYGPATERR